MYWIKRKKKRKKERKKTSFDIEIKAENKHGARMKENVSQYKGM
jgi:hypothetical protein